MKPHQGLTQAATCRCQLWQQNFSGSAAVRLLYLQQLLLSISPLLGQGQLVISPAEVICTLSHTKVSRVLLAASLFLSLLTSSVFFFFGGGASFGGGGLLRCFALRALSVQVAGRSFPGHHLSHRSGPLLDSSGFVGCPDTARKEFRMIWNSARLLALLDKTLGRARGLATPTPL